MSGSLPTPGELPDLPRSPASTVPEPGARGTSGWVVLTALSAAVLVILGSFHLAVGLGALLTDERFLIRDADSLGGLDTSVWGSFHVAVGALLVVAGILVLAGRRWARAVGVVVCLLSAALTLPFLSDHPGWGLGVLVVDGLIVLALTVHGSEIRAGRPDT